MEILSLALQGRLTAVDSRRWWKGKKIDFIQLYYLYALAQTETVAVIQSNCDFFLLVVLILQNQVPVQGVSRLLPRCGMVGWEGVE